MHHHELFISNHIYFLHLLLALLFLSTPLTLNIYYISTNRQSLVSIIFLVTLTIYTEL